MSVEWCFGCQDCRSYNLHKDFAVHHLIGLSCVFEFPPESIDLFFLSDQFEVVHLKQLILFYLLPGDLILQSVDQFGTKLEGDYMTTGFALYFCQEIIEPILDQVKNYSRQQAIELLEECFKILFYRDSRAGNTLRMVYLEKKGNDVEFGEVDKTILGNWTYDRFLNVGNETIYTK